MMIEVKLEGYGKASSLICQAGCPCLHGDEFGYDCGLEYDLGNVKGASNGWANYDTGEVMRTKKESKGQYVHPGAGWYKKIIRPQACIDQHGE